MRTGITKVLVIIPLPLDEDGVRNRRGQLASCEFGPDIQFDFRPVKAGSTPSHSYHDWAINDCAILEAGIEAQREGYNAVCIDTMSDSGVNPLRSVLDIPVIGPSKASYLMALMLGAKFSILTLWEPWKGIYRRTLQEYDLAEKCASIRSINVTPDLRNLLGGKEEDVFPLLMKEALQCLEDGAEVICLGSTSMYQAHGHLAQNLPVPVINPGPLTYKFAEMLVDLALSHSRLAYAKPRHPRSDMLHAMLDATVQKS